MTTALIDYGSGNLRSAAKAFERAAAEHGIAGEVVAMHPGDPALKVPHMGWNELEPRLAHPLLAGIDKGEHVYFVHSFEIRCENPAHVLATTDYGGSVVAMVGRDNLAGTQFHPEKSQQAGLRLIANFLR